MSSPSPCIIAVTIAALSCLATLANAAEPTDNCPHLRPREQAIVELIRQGKAESPLLQQLIDRITVSDVIVYVRIDRELPSHVDGQLTFLTAAGNHRYVVVSLAPGRSQYRAIAVLGHELRHAVEVADHPEIVDVPTFSRAYQRFGFNGPRTWRGRTFDTQAAIDAGDRIRTEVRRRVGTMAEAATLLETRP